MGHTNTTVNYGLPQFITSDKPAWLTDINGAFSDIDLAIKTAKNAADAAQGDATQALSDAAAAANTATAADAKGSGAVASIEAAFDPTTIYSVGAKVMYNSLLYRCTVAVVTPGPWTGAANWERITVDSIIPTSANEVPMPSAPYTAGSTAAAIDAVADSIPTLTLNARTLAFAGSKLAYVDVDHPANKIIPQSALLAADAGVPLSISVQALTSSSSRIRVTANTNYTSNIALTFFVIS